MRLLRIVFALCGLYSLQVVGQDPDSENYANVACQFNLGGTQVCDCGFSKYLMKLPPDLFGNVKELQIINCEHILLTSNILQAMTQLNKIVFSDINELVLQEYSMNLTRAQNRITVEFKKVIVEEIPSHFFKGPLSNLLFANSTIGRVHSFALTGLSRNMTSIKILNCTINQIEQQAFKKLNIDELLISNSTFSAGSVSKTFYDCNIRTLRIDTSQFGSLSSSAFSLNNVGTLAILNNTFDDIEGEAFVMKVAGIVEINNNFIKLMHFAAFQRISVSDFVERDRTGDVLLEFNNNRVDTIFPESNLQFAERIKLQMNSLFIVIPKSCERINNLFEKQFFSDHSNAIYMRVVDSDNEYNTMSHHQNNRCHDVFDWFWILMIILAVVVFFVILIPFLLCVYFKRQKRKLDIVMPEPRTYRQTQIVMQIENHGLLKTDF